MLDKGMKTKTIYFHLLSGDSTAKINIQIYGSVFKNNKIKQSFDEKKLIKLSKRKDVPNTELLFCANTLADLKVEVGMTIKAICAQ